MPTQESHTVEMAKKKHVQHSLLSQASNIRRTTDFFKDIHIISQ